ncbi:hypothetical protein SAMN05444007_102328 [Cribrihabitans marinus]|uniref:Histidine kinase n=1 Tax=Cribrihabitans marinus TaxID=1227549 RepID=A0A1H6TN20_9RHOB|nr:DUF6446 family protein [Cribrihabitans marinus]GGH21995.1 signal transduction histidine kinase [Cribrihabitans marinus]SEI77615.1 hypothetical protein SAMN05444007_102328 [Cribrihabitans marinus]
MSGKILAMIVLVSAAIAGGALYYFQIYGYYYDVAAQPGRDVMLLPQDAEAPEPITYSEFRAIDADSSPIRYRACFETEAAPEALAATYMPAEAPEPLTAPGWFDCFDAVALADDLAAGRARAFIGQKNVHFGVDRIVAVTADGRGYAWNALNNCGRKTYDGTQVGEDCPPRPTAGQ